MRLNKRSSLYKIKEGSIANDRKHLVAVIFYYCTTFVCHNSRR